MPPLTRRHSLYVAAAATTGGGSGDGRGGLRSHDGSPHISCGHDKNGDLLGFAATDEFGSVTDMTKNGNEFDVLRDDG